MQENNMVRQILDDCQPGFAEVVIMLANASATAEVYTMFEGLEFTDDGKIVTFSAAEGTHLHLQMDDVKEVKFLQTTNQQGLPSYSVWFIDENQEPMLRVYLRKSEIEETNQPRHDLFMGLIEKYGESLPVA